MSTPEITLYNYWRSSASWRVRWALQHKQIPYKYVPVNLLTGEHRAPTFLKINASGSVPCIEYRGTIFNESMAIIEWLDEKFLQQPLLPQSPDDRLIVRSLSLLIVSGTAPIQNLKVLKYISDIPSEREKFAAHWIQDGLKNYEAMLRQNRCAGTYSFGAHVTMADLCLIPQCFNALRFNVDLGQFPLIKGIYQRCLALEACDAAAPHKQVDAV